MPHPKPQTPTPKPMCVARSRFRAFTLVELLVVISIIALLIAILMPALASGRRAAQLAQSLSNLRQIGIASAAYAADNDGSPPFVPTGEQYGTTVITAGWCTWSFGGKFNDPYWASRSGGIFDLAPDGRPINAYVYSEKLHPPVTGTIGYSGHERPANESQRIENLELEVFRSPRDIATMQRTWPNPIYDASSYDDVGTSYHSNKKWVLQFRDAGLNINDAFQRGHRAFKTTSGIDPSRFVLYHDQVADVILTPWSPGLPVVNADFGRENQSAMTYFDGHANLTEIQPNQPEGDDYTFTIDTD
ncbi:prepilin-type N-terminal cleavage/methylation domain-containing protein [Phycisphaeraceae bacterium D3-23]